MRSLRSHETIWSRALHCDLDVQVAPLVEAMNKIPGVETVSSCQGEPGKLSGKGEMGHVAFKLKGDWQALCSFCFVNLRNIFSDFIDDEVRVDIFCSTRPYAWINFRHEMLELVTGRMRGLASASGRENAT